MKRLLILFLISLDLYAVDFNTLLQEALTHSPYLKANALEIERSQQQADLTQRYENPTLSLELSDFSPTEGKDTLGYKAAFSQPIRLWGVGDNRAELATASKTEAKSFVTLKHAEFVKNFSLLYIDYMTRTALVELAEQSLRLSEKITRITKERYEAGTIAKVRYLQSGVDLSSARNLLDEKKMLQLSSYYTLLSFCGFDEEKQIDTRYRFTRSKSTQEALQNASPQLHYLKSRQDTATALSKLNSNKVEWVDLYGEFESEPDQNIARIGLDIPLALFNTKTQEKRIAELEARKNELLFQNKSSQRLQTLKRLEKELELLEKLSRSTQKLFDSQKELLKMYEESYKIASTNFIEMLYIKNQLIRTKAKEISLQNRINQNIVNYNYEAGDYND